MSICALCSRYIRWAEREGGLSGDREEGDERQAWNSLAFKFKYHRDIISAVILDGVITHGTKILAIAKKNFEKKFCCKV